MSELKPCPAQIRWMHHHGKQVTHAMATCPNRAPDPRVSRLATQLEDESRRANAMANLEAAATAENIRLRENADRLVEALAGLVEYVERNTCRHEQTHRGGAIWTICDECGRKWADDMGGFKPYRDPKAIVKARAVLAEYDGTEPGKEKS